MYVINLQGILASWAMWSISHLLLKPLSSSFYSVLFSCMLVMLYMLNVRNTEVQLTSQTPSHTEDIVDSLLVASLENSKVQAVINNQQNHWQTHLHGSAELVLNLPMFKMLNKLSEIIWTPCQFGNSSGTGRYHTNAQQHQPIRLRLSPFFKSSVELSSFAGVTSTDCTLALGQGRVTKWNHVCFLATGR